MGKHYDFIEIGTSDFDTLIENADDNTVGLSIEPIKFYLDRLPNKKNVTKVNAAVSEFSGWLDMYHIEENEIIKNNLPYWVRGCNSVDKPHEYVVSKIGQELYSKIVTKTRVIKLCWSYIIDTFNIESIGRLKIDTEGHDHIILKSYLDKCKINPKLFADTIEFECNEISDKEAIEDIISSLDGYDVHRGENDIVLTKKKHEKAYLLYANEAYFDTVSSCVKSINTFSNIPVYVYMLNSDLKVNGATTIRWDCDIVNIEKQTDDNFYIDRSDYNIFRLLIERPMVAKDCLKYAKKIVYIDSDSVSTPIVDSIFNFKVYDYPLFVEGIYDWLHIDGRGGAETRSDLTTTLEHPACELFGVNQNIRERYRQTGYFVYTNDCIDFLNEWYAMCNHHEVVNNFRKYAPYHEETIANVLLWKKGILDGLPYIYVNTSIGSVHDVYNNLEFGVHHGTWKRLPNKNQLFFFHGEKRPDIMNQMIEQMKAQPKKLKVLFLAPHLSTGGMPAFLLKRIESIIGNTDMELFVVEYANYSNDFVVQKDAIKSLLIENFFTLGENKLDLINIIESNSIDVVHIDEMVEMLDESLANALYSNDRTWRMVETCHNISFNHDEEKKYHPDLYMFCTPYHEQTFKNTESNYTTIEFPIDEVSTPLKDIAKHKLGFDISKKHVLNVGLWTSGKNQGEGLEIARKYPNMMFHFVGNQAMNFADYWVPLMKDIPENVKVWGERSDINKFMYAADIFMFNSTWECNPLVLREAISYGLPIIARNLPQYSGMYDDYINPIDTDLDKLDLSKRSVPKNKSSEVFELLHLTYYHNIIKYPIRKQKVVINHNFIGNPFLEIKGVSNSTFKVQFYNEKKELCYEDTIKTNHWVKLNREYYTKWNTKVWENDNLIFDDILGYTNKKVYIAIDSKSLGDTIAWIPYALEFKKKHNCTVICSTFWNSMFDYPELEFVEPGTIVNGIHGMYKLGWFYNENKEPEVPHNIPMQKAATNILGLDYSEIKPVMKCDNEEKIKQVCIGFHSTAQAKYWNNEGEWQKLVDYIISKGYVVKLISREGEEYMGNQAPIGVVLHPSGSIESVMKEIKKSEMFIGIGSGLSWLSWALDTPTVIISGFSEPFAEMEDCVRVSAPLSKCSGCFNRYQLNAGDWNWCPDHKGTDRQFECTKSITAQMVIDKIVLGHTTSEC